MCVGGGDMVGVGVGVGVGDIVCGWVWVGDMVCACMRVCVCGRGVDMVPGPARPASVASNFSPQGT